MQPSRISLMPMPYFRCLDFLIKVLQWRHIHIIIIIIHRLITELSWFTRLRNLLLPQLMLVFLSFCFLLFQLSFPFPLLLPHPQIFLFIHQEHSKLTHSMWEEEQGPIAWGHHQPSTLCISTILCTSYTRALLANMALQQDIKVRMRRYSNIYIFHKRRKTRWWSWKWSWYNAISLSWMLGSCAGGGDPRDPGNMGLIIYSTLTMSPLQR